MQQPLIDVSIICISCKPECEPDSVLHNYGITASLHGKVSSKFSKFYILQIIFDWCGADTVTFASISFV